YGYGMLVVGRRLPVGCRYGPAVIPKFNSRFAGIDHWLYGYNHTFFQFHARPAPAIIWHLGPLVQFQSNTMANQLFHYAKPVAFGMFLHRISYIADTHAGHRFLNTQVKAFFGNTH